MKSNLFLFLLAFILIFTGCSKDSSKESNSSIEKTEMEVEVKGQQPVSLIESYQNQIKESFFFFFRKERYGLDHYNFIKHENITIEGTSIKYTLVTVPKSVVNDFIMSNEPNLKASFIDFSSDEFEDENFKNDTVIYRGVLSVVDTIVVGNEGSISSLKILLTGSYSESSFGPQQYGDSNRRSIYDGFDTELIVDVKNPRIYKRDEMYLKARIFNLTNEDLNAYSKEELSYLRNEIFARHGHSFKTDKMKNYFSQKEWYKPYANDATESLNEIEKRNAQFIRGMEENS